MDINELVYNEYVQGSDRVAFLEKVIDVARRLGIPPNRLMGIMYIESARTFSASITNFMGCRGLTQFCGENIEKYLYGDRYYNRVAQLEAVYDYFTFWKRIYPNALDSLESMYMINFLPAFTPWANGPDNTVIEYLPQFPAWVLARDNKGFDLNGDGKITLGEWRTYLRTTLDPRVFEDEKKTYFGVTVIGWLAIAFLIGAILIIRFRKPLTNMIFKK